MQFNFEYWVDVRNWTLTILDIFLMVLLGVCVKKPLNLFSLGTVRLVELDFDLILVAPGFWLYVSIEARLPGAVARGSGRSSLDDGQPHDSLYLAADPSWLWI